MITLEFNTTRSVMLHFLQTKNNYLKSKIKFWCFRDVIWVGTFNDNLVLWCRYGDLAIMMVMALTKVFWFAMQDLYF